MNIKLIGLLIMLLYSASLSAGIKFNPIQLNIQDFKRQKSTTVNIESTGLSKSKIYEVNAFKWQQDEKGRRCSCKKTELYYLIQKLLNLNQKVSRLCVLALVSRRKTWKNNSLGE